MMASDLDISLRVPRAWAPRTVDLDDRSTFDLRADGTADVDEAFTRDLTAPIRPSCTRAASTLSSEPTSDLNPADVTPLGERRQDSGTSSTPGLDAPASGRAPSAHSLEATAMAGHSAPVAPGAVLLDRYLIEQALGAGGTAWVFRARDLTVHKNAPGARIAIKTPRPDMRERERAIARLQHEFRCAQLLRHPNIVRVLELGHDDRTWFMTMELIEGRSLAALMREPVSLPPALKRAVLTACAQALAYAHRNDVVHGDFKPSNVLVSANGQVKVFDFGAATWLEQEDRTRIPAGTPAYASPQVLSGARPDPRDDVFSFACVAYELLTGRHPFGRRSSLEARQQGQLPPRPEALSTWQWLTLSSALSFDRDQRPTDVEKVVNILLADAAPDPSSTSPAQLGRMPPTSPSVRAAPDSGLVPQPGWGFFLFLACALGLILIGAQHQRGSDNGASIQHSLDTAPEQEPVEARIHTQAPLPSKDATSDSASPVVETEPPAATAPATKERARRAPSANRPPEPTSDVSLESVNIVTSESALAAVFILKRSEPLSHRVEVRWRAESGTAKVGVDLSANVSGIAVLPEGHTRRAIYVPLLNDQTKEDDETFTLRLEAVRGARLVHDTAYATILDDD